MSYLFIKSLFQRKKFVLFSYKNKNKNKPKKTFLVGFFRWVFLGGFFWVGFLLPTLLREEVRLEGEVKEWRGTYGFIW
jgi:hypothetical protein